MIDPTNLDTYASYRDTPFQTKELKQSEVSIFFKMTTKVAKRLTLNLGLRWDYYGVPY
jgi:outer membrane receptor protein involved in Fe transport